MIERVRNITLEQLKLWAIAIGGSVVLAACLTFRAETPEQHWYAAKAEYLVTLQMAAAYAESPEARPEVVARMVEADRRAQIVIEQGDAIVQGGGDATLTQDFARLLDLLREVLRAELREGAR